MLSVIIPTRNRSQLLNFAIKSIQNQTLHKSLYEILIVDNDSTDNTKKIIKSYESKLSNLRYIYCKKPGLHEGRHMGMNKAKNEILIFADDDIEATTTWLEAYYKVFQDQNVVLSGGNNMPLFINNPPVWLNSLWRKPMFSKIKKIPILSLLEVNGPSRKFSPYLVWGCNFAIRKKILHDAGGFHPDGMPKDLLQFRGDGETHIANFISQNNLMCVFHPNASVFHKVTPERMTIRYFYERGFSQGISNSYADLRGDCSKNSKSLIAQSKSMVATLVKENLNRIFLHKKATKALNEFKRGALDGYQFHQESYLSNPKLKAWVHKDKYY